MGPDLPPVDVVEAAPALTFGLRPAAGPLRAVEPQRGRSASGCRTASRRRTASRCRTAACCRTASRRRTASRCRTTACCRTAARCRTAKYRRAAAGIRQGRPESSRVARDCGRSRGGGPRHLRDTLCARTLSRRRRRPRRRTHAEAVSSSCQPAAGHHRQPEVEQREPRVTGSGARRRAPPSSCPRKTWCPSG